MSMKSYSCKERANERKIDCRKNLKHSNLIKCFSILISFTKKYLEGRKLFYCHLIMSVRHKFARQDLFRDYIGIFYKLDFTFFACTLSVEFRLENNR